MSFGDAISSVLRNYATFSGRAPRSEYWYWALFILIVSVIAMAIDLMVFSASGYNPVGTVVSLGLLLPNISVAVRRLHDIDRTGWWFLIAFTIIGIILLIVWACQKGTAGPNSYGQDPIRVF
jgi:uncharacterized membrane protein YhaH (DUF805 family)